MAMNIPASAGLSSYNLLDDKLFFSALELEPGMTVLDLACGVGNYAVASYPLIGKTGYILAMDVWREGIETLRVRADMQGAVNILPLVGDAAGKLPVRYRSIDCCLMATIAHILAQQNALAGVLDEVRNVLRPGGVLAVVEFHKIEGPPGPPLAWRLAPEDLEGIASASGYRLLSNSNIGPYNYLSMFHPAR